MTRVVALALGAVGLVVYAIVRVRGGTDPAPAIVGAALGIVVLFLLARRR